MNGVINILLRELCLLVDVLICFGIPIVGILLIDRMNRRNDLLVSKGKNLKVIKPFFIGMLAFVISQPLLRIPILHYVLPNFGWYLTLQINPYLYGIFLGLTAGLFEESARLIFMKLFMKDRIRMADGLAFGLGHGGIEAILLTGINCIATMVMYPIGQTDLSNVNGLTILSGGMERVFAMTFHVGASLIVLYGIRNHKAIRYTLLAIILHALLDSMLIILPATIRIGAAGIELYIFIVSLLVLIFAINLWIRSGNKRNELVS